MFSLNTPHETAVTLDLKDKEGGKFFSNYVSEVKIKSRPSYASFPVQFQIWINEDSEFGILCLKCSIYAGINCMILEN